VISCEPSCVPMVNAMISQGIIEQRRSPDEKRYKNRVIRDRVIGKVRQGAIPFVP